MFYEGRVNQIWNIDGDEILSVLGQGQEVELKHVKKKDGTPYQAGLYAEILYVFEHNGKKYAFANDASSCNGIVELAILDFDKMIQIESLTIGWVKGDKLNSILSCCDNPMLSRKVDITFDESGKVTRQPETYFECGCCGEGFKSTAKLQAIHDQDMGYGICEDCE